MPRASGLDLLAGRPLREGGQVSGICGYVGEPEPSVLDAMLAAIDYRGDRTDTAFGDRKQAQQAGLEAEFDAFG